MRRLSLRKMARRVYKIENEAFSLSDETSDLSTSVTRTIRDLASMYDSSESTRVQAELKAVNAELKDAVAALYRAHGKAKQMYQRLNRG